MKRTGLMLLLTAFIISFSCQKETHTPAQVTASKDAVWLAPNGYVIPYSEKDNWKEYTASQFTGEKVERRRFKSQSCDPAGESSCGLECIETRDRNADCVAASACAPCMNCGCTPTTSGQ